MIIMMIKIAAIMVTTFVIHRPSVPARELRTS